MIKNSLFFVLFCCVVFSQTVLNLLSAYAWLNFRYLKSIVETILIYQHFKKLNPEQHVAKQELVDFWMDFLVEATKTDVSIVRFPVSVCFFIFFINCLI